MKVLLTGECDGTCKKIDYLSANCCKKYRTLWSSVRGCLNSELHENHNLINCPCEGHSSLLASWQGVSSFAHLSDDNDDDTDDDDDYHYQGGGAPCTLVWSPEARLAKSGRRAQASTTWVWKLVLSCWWWQWRLQYGNCNGSGKDSKDNGLVKTYVPCYTRRAGRLSQTRCCPSQYRPIENYKTCRLSNDDYVEIGDDFNGNLDDGWRW